MPLDQAVLDFQSLGIDRDATSGPRQRVAARRRPARHDRAACSPPSRGAGLRPEGVDLSAFAHDPRAARRGPPTAPCCTCRVDGLTNLAVAQGPLCLFTRVVGRRPRGARGRARRAPRPHARARPRLAAPRRRRHAARGGSKATPRSSPSARTVLPTACAASPTEIRNSLDFHHMQSPGAPVARAILTGPASRFPASPTPSSTSSACPSSRGVVDGAPAGVDSAASRSPRASLEESPARGPSTSFRPTSAAAPASPAAAAAPSTSLLGVLGLVVLVRRRPASRWRTRSRTRRTSSRPSTTQAQQAEARPGRCRPTPSSPPCARPVSRRSPASPRAASTGPTPCTRSPAPCPPARR